MKVKLIPIGNSKGVRIPQVFIRACELGEHVEMRIEQADTLQNMFAFD